MTSLSRRPSEIVSFEWKRGVGRHPFNSSEYYGNALNPLYLGIACTLLTNNSHENVEVAITIHDGSYSLDYSLSKVFLEGCTYPSNDECGKSIETYLYTSIQAYEREHEAKFVVAGVTQDTAILSPGLTSGLWQLFDIVPVVVRTESGSVDEQADSAVRKALSFFGPLRIPHLFIGYRNKVEVDAYGRIQLLRLSDYQRDVSEGMWQSCLKYAEIFRANNLKLGFFSATPRGGGVALMRHALVRLARLLKVEIEWYVPKPNPAVFRITKNNHNILQGVAKPDVKLTDEGKAMMEAWITENATRYWITDTGGPISRGGISVAVIDDPQMPGLIPLIKAARPDIPVIYRSHIEIRSDLVSDPESEQANVWNYLYKNIKMADLFISHPVDAFVPANVNIDKVGLLPAATDFRDGLNKSMNEWDLRFYMQQFRSLCEGRSAALLDFPNRDYIIQIARFDPSKGIPDVIESFLRFRNMLQGNLPQLVICGHGAIDDPDGAEEYAKAVDLLAQERYKSIANDVVIMRLGPSDRLLNALLSNAKIALQLSLREGFEVKVSEALHKGIPVVAYRAGGIPLQIKHGVNGYLCDIGDVQQVAERLAIIWENGELYYRLVESAHSGVSDEVGTVGNLTSWLFLAIKLTRDKGFVPKGQWINELLRNDADYPYERGEVRLPRDNISVQR